jgi:hypothetical protein
MFDPSARTFGILARKRGDIANERTSSTAKTPVETFLNIRQAVSNKMEDGPKIYPCSSAKSVI